MWLTITPARLTIASSAMKPNGDLVTAKPSNAPINPSGTVNMTTTDLMTDLNCTTIVIQISASETCITRFISDRFFRNSSSSPANRIS